MALNRKIALIDLGKKEIEVFPVSRKQRRKFIGGRGVGARLLYKHALRGCDPLGPDNAMVISAGLLAGSLTSPHSPVCIMAGSPLTGLMARALSGGFFAAEMRWAGFDHLILKGRAPHPVYLYICDGKIEIRDAEKIRGLGVFDSREMILKELGDDEVKMLTAGPAGENLVRFANVVSDRRHAAGRTGMGAVLGSKNVKAVACRGAMDLEIKNPDQALKPEMAFSTPSASEKGGPVKAASPGAEWMIRDIPFAWREGFDAASLSDSSRLAMDLGVDFPAVRGMIHWAMDLFEKGVITRSDTDGLDLTRANDQAAPELIKRIAARQGLGAILAEGPLRAARKIGRGSLDHFLPVQALIKLHTEDELDPAVPAGPHAAASRPDKNNKYKGAPGSIPWPQLSEILYDCLGIGDGRDPRRIEGRAGFGPAAERIQLNTGLRFHENELRDAAYRCHAVERLFDIRETTGAPPDLFFDAPPWFGMDETMWNDIDLPKFKFFATQHHQVEGWDKESLINKKILENLGISDMWPTRR